jgi:hypothetical protein
MASHRVTHGIWVSESTCVCVRITNPARQVHTNQVLAFRALGEAWNVRTDTSTLAGLWGRGGEGEEG